MKKRVLVVDDDESVRESLSKVLLDAGYEVALAADGQTALEQFDPGQIDLLLLDIGLPDKSGWDTFENINRQNPLLPVIVITGHTGQFNMASAAGAGALLEKPLDAPQLLETMEELLAEPNETHLLPVSGYSHDARHLPA